MSVSGNDLADGVVLTGSQFSEPMRVIGNPTAGDGFVLVNLVGTRTSTFIELPFQPRGERNSN